MDVSFGLNRKVQWKLGFVWLSDWVVSNCCIIVFEM